MNSTKIASLALSALLLSQAPAALASSAQALPGKLIELMTAENKSEGKAVYRATAEASHPEAPCLYAATTAFTAAWEACDSAGYGNCRTTRKSHVARSKTSCKVEITIRGSRR